MMGIGVVDALKHLGCKSIAIASTYYSGEMSMILSDFLTESGINVLNNENPQSQKLSDNNSDLFVGEGNLDPFAWETPFDAVRTAVRNTNRQVPEADGILVPGGGMRILNIVDSLEKEINKPVIGGDISLYWGILTRLNIKKRLSGYGQLLASL
jgi:maleate cis-trans isomerase